MFAVRSSCPSDIVTFHPPGSSFVDFCGCSFNHGNVTLCAGWTNLMLPDVSCSG